VAVAEELHFRRAAERLYIAQPAVSEQIRKLEEELGVRLFDRMHRGVTLTEPGRALLVEARRVLQSAEVAMLAARNARDAAGERLRIGYVPSALPASVPRALQQVASAASRVEVALETGGALRLTQSVRDGRLDAAVVGLPSPTKGLRITTLGHQTLVAALPAADARSLEGDLTLERLAPERVVLLPREANPALHDAVVSLCHQAGLSPDFVEAAEPRVEAVLLSVAAGRGAALLPASITERFAAPGVRLVALTGAAPVFESAVLTHPDTDHAATQAFLSILSRAPTTRPAQLQLAA
jgi:DNA-binding transcriptional LysR family regulator